MLPVRCFTCNKVLGHLEHDLQTWKKENTDKNLLPFYESHQIVRLCCRKVLLTYYNEDDFLHQHHVAEIPSSIKVQPSTPFTQIYRAV